MKPLSDFAITSHEELRSMAVAFQRSRILLTAWELDLFTILGEKGLSSAEAAEQVKANPHAVDRLMNALCALGLLSKERGRFFNTPLAGKYLVKGKPDFMSNLGHTSHTWDSWSHLTQAVKQGGPIERQPMNDRGEMWLEAFIAAMHNRARIQAPKLAALLDLSEVSRILDVGGGSGAFAMAMVRAREGSTAVVFDLPGVVPIARRYIEQEGLAERVSTAEGDFIRDELGSGFDLVFLSAIVHMLSPEQNISLLKKCARALNPGGQIVIQDFIIDEDRTSPAFATLFALNMLVATDSGDTYTESEMKDWMQASGFGEVKRIDTDFGTGLMMGRK
jgi:predicted O-methyltransferase YrrM